VIRRSANTRCLAALKTAVRHTDGLPSYLLGKRETTSRASAAVARDDLVDATESWADVFDGYMKINVTI
jgi:hypothetical protein